MSISPTPRSSPWSACAFVDYLCTVPLPSPSGPSPCMELSSIRTTVPHLTACRALESSLGSLPSYSPPSFTSLAGSPVFPMEDSNKTMEVAHCQRSHPLSAAPQTEHGVQAGSPLHSSTGPTGSPSVELPAVVMTGSVGLAGIIGKVCQGHSSPKDDMRFR